jgi:hypothetical protein
MAHHENNFYFAAQAAQTVSEAKSAFSDLADRNALKVLKK